MNTARDLVTAERCTVFLIDREKEQLWSKLAQDSGEICLPMSAGIAGHVATTGQILNIPDAYSDQRFNKTFDIKSGFKTRNILCTPMINSKGEIMGVFQAINKISDTASFTTDDVNQITSFSSVAASTIEKSLEFTEMQQDLANLNNELAFLGAIMNNKTSAELVFNESGKLLAISNADMLELKPLIPTMQMSSYEHWLGHENSQLVDDISRAILSMQRYTASNVRLYLKGYSAPKYINYTVAPLHSKSETIVLRNKTKSRNRFKAEEFSGQASEPKFILTIVEMPASRFLMELLSKQVSQSTMNDIRISPALVSDPTLSNVAILTVNIKGCILINTVAEIQKELENKSYIEYLDGYYDAVSEAAKSLNGMLHDFKGSFCVCVFGAPILTDEYAIQAGKAALAIQTALENISTKYQQQGLPALSAVISVSSGPAHCGAMGPAQLKKYKVVGVPCEISEEIAKFGGVYGCKALIDQTTQEKLQERFHLRLIDVVMINGVAKALYELIGSIEQPLLHDIMTTMICYDLGLQEYKAKNWQAAIMHFKKAIALSDDKPARAFVERCKNLLDSKAQFPGDWNGVWSYKE